ncbi:hypothetical protein DL765_008396 [Monosporascus sp. GIB2]|nr:hypothetical protein DL765_008396 [Monosporascus sp. GIB2]
MADSENIQLVLLYPADDKTSPIVCDLISFDSEDEATPQFVALSYVAHARAQSPKTMIYVDGADVTVFDTLAAILRCMRHTTAYIHLWIDPLCTKDSEPQGPKDVIRERSSIYALATDVVVWLGEETQTSKAEIRAALALGRHWDIKGLPRIPEILGFMEKTPLFGTIFGLTQLFFSKPWWHWERIGALADVELGPKTSFHCGERQLHWDAFVSLVLTLRFALPRLRTDYSVRLDQVLLQIPGRIPEVFREVFHCEIKGDVPSEDTSAWGYGPLFSHPQDVLYWMSSTSEEHKVGRVLTRLSTRLCNRYRNKCRQKLRRDMKERAKRGFPRGIRPHQEPDDDDDVLDAGDSDIALQIWLSVLIDRAALTRDEETLNILRPAYAKMGSQGYGLVTPQHPQDDNHPYTYGPLTPDVQELRVLLLHPSSDAEAKLQCDLFPLDTQYWRGVGVESLPFMALSYTWGDPDSPRWIVLGGKKKKVTPSLFEALHNLRDARLPVLLWVDAICINQDDVEEKNHQVGMMDVIYKQAGCVLVWIDKEGDDPPIEPLSPGDTSLNFMGALSIVEIRLFSPQYKIGGNDEEQPRVDETMRGLSGYAFFHASKIFFSRRYWSRVWTMQEILLGRNVLVCHGGYAIYFRAVQFMFMKLYMRMLPQDTADRTDYVDDTPVEQFLTVSWEILNGNSPSLFKALLMSRERHATMKHDHLFGVLGLVEREESWQVADYKRDLFSVSSEAFRYILEQEGNLDVLSACEVRNHYQIDPARRLPDDLPWSSWLPDWSITPFDPTSIRSVLFAQHADQKNRFCAAGNTQPAVCLGDDERLLSIKGMLVDEIDLVDATDCLKSRVAAFKSTLSLGQPVLIDLFTPVPSEDDGESDERLEDTLLDDADEENLNESESYNSVRKGVKVLNGIKCPDYVSKFFITRRGYIGRGPISIRKVTTSYWENALDILSKCWAFMADDKCYRPTLEQLAAPAKSKNNIVVICGAGLSYGVAPLDKNVEAGLLAAIQKLGEEDWPAGLQPEAAEIEKKYFTLELFASGVRHRVPGLVTPLRELYRDISPPTKS